MEDWRRRLRRHLLSVLALAAAFFLVWPAAVPGRAAAELFYRNPVHPNTSGMGDPYVLRASDGRYYLYTTSGFEAWSSDDLVHWRSEGKVKTHHRWGQRDFWAPEVVEYRGKFYMYYSAEGPLPNGELGMRIAVAVSDSPTGPFEDVFDGPMFDFGYNAIDPHVFFDDDGRIYLFFAKDGSTNVVNGRRESHIYGVELNDDLVTLKGEPVFLSRPEQPWELLSGGFLWNEGPFVVKHDGIYYLMYSANCYCHRHYSVGYSTAVRPLGPYVKYAGNPILSARFHTGQGFPYLTSGTGHHSVIRSPDGSEWFIVYHSHSDPVAGSGGRQLNIDRMGFREDGTLYVNGPTVTPQPVPAGVTKVRNIAPEAAVTASSTRPGHSTKALVDGEIGVDVLKARYDWVSEGERDGAWVQLTWDVPRHLEYVLIYPSAAFERKLSGGRLVFSDGTELEVRFPEEPGAAAIVPAPYGAVEWVRFEAGPPVQPDGHVGLSEIMALGYPLGTAWIAVPQPYGEAGDDTAIRIMASGLEPMHVRFAVDGAVVYEGADLPSEPLLDAGELGEGVHHMVLELTDASGNKYVDEVEYGVVYARWLAPAEAARLSGTVSLAAEMLVPEGNVAAVTLALAPVAGGERAGWHVLYTGPVLPPELTLDTLAYDDGAYDLIIQVATRQGLIGLQSRRVVFENWTELDEPFEPPLDAGWFGVQERLRTVAKSPGWVYPKDAAEEFWGDTGRIAPEPGRDVWLVWRHPSLDDFRFTAYATTVELTGRVLVSVSADAAHWTEVPFDVRVVDAAPTGWYRLELAGTVPEGAEAHYIRLTVAGTSGLGAGAFQLGHARLRSRN